MRYRVYATLITIGLGVFAVQCWDLAHWASALNSATDQLEVMGGSLIQESHQITSLGAEARTESQELGYLESLQDLLPRDKGYLRTQKVIADEVQSLRRKVGQRLRGRLHILVDTKANKLYFKKGLNLLWEADCSVGRGGTLLDKKTGRHWEFVTPRGQFEVLSKIKHPLWIKPDWAFVESGEAVPPPQDPKRRTEGELGDYVLNLGDGYLIHGTKDEKVLGHAVSHGCVRLGAQDLEKLYDNTPLGTAVYIY